jgi:hypothetical protein
VNRSQWPHSNTVALLKLPDTAGHTQHFPMPMQGREGTSPTARDVQTYRMYKHTRASIIQYTRSATHSQAAAARKLFSLSLALTAVISLCKRFISGSRVRVACGSFCFHAETDAFSFSIAWMCLRMRMRRAFQYCSSLAFSGVKSSLVLASRSCSWSSGIVLPRGVTRKNGL